MTICHTVCLILFAFVFNTQSLLYTDGKWIKDEKGRIRILRGYNIAGDSKVPDFMPLKNKLHLLDQLQDLGADIVRLLFIWEAYETSPGQYNQQYIKYNQDVIQYLQQMGIYVFIDLHQDGFSRWYLDGCGDGFPQWTVPKILQSPPNNSEQKCSHWGVTLQEPSWEIAYKNFFANWRNIKTAYLKVISDIGNAFSTFENVVGFDLMNEPKGNEITELTPYYKQAADILLNINPDYLMFFEPQQVVTSGLVESQLPKQPYKNAIFAPHFYNPLSYVGIYDFGVQTRISFERLNRKTEELQVPQFMGEFGCKIMDYTKDYINDMYDQMDEHFIGGTQWTFTPTWNNVTFDGWNGENFSIVDNLGNLRPGYVLRPSIRAVPGIPISFKFKKIWNTPFQFIWQHNSSLVNATMEIYLPVKQLKYEQQWLKVSDGLKCQFTGYKNYYLACTCVDECSGQKSVSIEVD